MHRWDVHLAAGRTSVLDARLSADGVDEVVAVMLPRQLRLRRVEGLPATIVLAQRDDDARWLIGVGESQATLHADAATLLLLLWRRSTLDRADVDVQGDADAARAVLSLPLTP